MSIWQCPRASSLAGWACLGHQDDALLGFLPCLPDLPYPGTRQPLPIYNDRDQISMSCLLYNIRIVWEKRITHLPRSSRLPPSSSGIGLLSLPVGPASLPVLTPVSWGNFLSANSFTPDSRAVSVSGTPGRKGGTWTSLTRVTLGPKTLLGLVAVEILLSASSQA